MPAKTQKITVTSKRKGFRRCGISWGDKSAEVEMSAAMVKTLKAEPQLIVFDGWLSAQNAQPSQGE